jgi:2,4-dienoyl-CoA reductase-like NADH-dependent reductase (Old Yellow Enzyme family)
MLEHLFSPLRIKGVTLRNRIVATAHNTGLNDALKIGDRLRAYYATRAQGGVGLMIMGSTSVHPSSNSRLRPDEGGVCFIRGGSAYR